jgi:uncharacterized protein YndB with AHSA1/START domain
VTKSPTGRPTPEKPTPEKPAPGKPAAETSDAGRTLVMTRRFAAPREAVFAAWTDPTVIARWIGPRSIKAEVKSMTAKPGGAYRIAMHGTDGSIRNVGGVYREVAPPERLVFTWAWEDGAGKQGYETLVTLTFRASGAATEMTLLHERFEDKMTRDHHGVGWAGSFDKLEEVLAGKPGRR